MRIFLSYPRELKDQVGLVFQTLSRAGHDVYFDLGEQSGRPFRNRIHEELSASDLVIAFLCVSGMADGRFFQTELELAIRQSTHSRTVILPVLMDDEVALPAELQAFTWMRPRGDLALEILGRVSAIDADRKRAGEPTGKGPGRMVIIGLGAVLVVGGSAGILASTLRSLPPTMEPVTTEPGGRSGMGGVPPSPDGPPAVTPQPQDAGTTRPAPGGGGKKPAWVRSDAGAKKPIAGRTEDTAGPALAPASDWRPEVDRLIREGQLEAALDRLEKLQAEKLHPELLIKNAEVLLLLKQWRRAERDLIQARAMAGYSARLQGEVTRLEAIAAAQRRGE